MGDPTGFMKHTRQAPKYLPVEACIAQTVRTWVFKNPDAAEADASWGFQFTPP